MRTIVDKKNLSLLVVATLVAAAAGCNNDLPVANQLERTRLLGARVVVAAEPGRADVLPGEAAAVEWLVAGPSAPATLDWGFAMCTGLGGGCKAPPQPIGTGSGTPVIVPFTTPDAAALDGGLLPLMLGGICADGTLGVDPVTARATCSGPSASGTAARFTVPVRPDGGSENRHPVLGNDTIELGGAVWDATTATAASPGDACDASTGLPVVPATPDGVEEVTQPIRLVSDGDDRETFTPVGATAATLEELQISNFATAGKFDASYAAIFATDTRPDADVTMKWAPPKAADVPAAGVVVTFHFVIRDLRGGLDWTSRALCVTP